MKKILAILVALILLLSVIGCESSKPADSNNTSPEKKIKIGMIVDILGANSFLSDAAAGFKAAAEAHNYEYRVVECADDAAYTENARALVNEQFDLIVGIGWKSGDAMTTIAKDYPDAAAYAAIDTIIEAENVKCIGFYEQEGAYLIGLAAALVVDGESSNYGAVHATQSAASWKWRYAYMQGVLSVDPNAKFVFNYVNSYADPATAKELALQQYELGCMFINAACSGGDYGVFEAAAEKNFYTSGQDVDLTNPSNPNIVTCQIKDTFAAVTYVVNAFASGNWDTTNSTLGIADGAIGAVYVTHESKNPRSSRLSDDDISKLQKAANDIKSGTINLRSLPDEDSFVVPAIK